MRIVFYLLILLLPVTLKSQGMIVNEISNGTSGSGGGVQEYMEFVVIGSAADPTGEVDLSGWIIDDNNGDFEALGSGVGIALGHLRIAPGCLTSVKPGSIILIYNDADRNPHIPSGSNDPDDSNEDCVYIFRVSDPCIQACTNRPSTTTSSYSGCTYAAATWTPTGMANSGDVGQVRQPGGAFFHGFAYGGVTTPAAPTFPASIGAGTGFSVAGTGTSGVFFFNSGSFTSLSNFTRGTSTTSAATTQETPGAPNNNANRYFLNSVRNGTYNYSNLNAAANSGSSATLDPCPSILSVKLQAFNAKKEERAVLLDWQLASSDTEYFTFELERSADAVDFYTIAVIDGHSSIESYLNYDREPLSKNYYRLKMMDANGEISYSQIRNVNFDAQTDILVYPNPLRGSRQLNVISESNIEAIEIYNALGQKVYSENNPMQQIDLPNEISAGFYTLIIKTEISEIVRKLVIE